MRSVFLVGFPTFRLDTAAPLLIFAVRDEESAKNLRLATWSGKGSKPAGRYRQTWEKQYGCGAPWPGRAWIVPGGVPRVRAQYHAHEYSVAAYMDGRGLG